MAFILETGSGTRSGNAYADEAFALAYLTDLSRETQNNWSTRTSPERQGALIAATLYIDQNNDFAGLPLRQFNGRSAQALITVAGLPTNGETITVGETQFTFVTTESTLGVNEVLIGASATEVITNLISAIEDSGECQATTEGTDQILLTAIVVGASGNSMSLSVAATNVTITSPFINGQDAGPQARAFPRCGLVVDTVEIVGVPLAVKQATVEYAVRAVANPNAALFVDPTYDASGRVIKREKLGPIETEFADGVNIDNLIRAYPAADVLLEPYLIGGGNGGTYR